MRPDLRAALIALLLAPAFFACHPSAAETLPPALAACQAAATPQSRAELCGQAIAAGKLTGDDLALALGLRAHARAALGDAEGALADIDKALKLSPGALDLLYQRGMAHLAIEDYAAAEKDFSAIIAIAPDDLDSLYQRAWARTRLGRDAEAIADLDAVLKARPEDAEARMDRGGLTLRLGRLAQAIADFSAILARDPNAAAAAYNRGRAYYLQGDFEKAAADFSAARRGRDGNPYASLRLYLAELHRGHDDKAILAESYATGSADQWPFPLIAVMLGKAKEDDLWPALSLKDADLARQFKIEAGFYLGEWQRASGDPARARTRLQRAAIPLDRDSPESSDAAAILATLK